jgi:hypothetical protein
MDTDKSNLETYIYQPLTNAETDIRLTKLLPGAFDDNIRLEIFHVTLKDPKSQPEIRLNRKELQTTVSPGCEVLQTVEGRFFFKSIYPTPVAKGQAQSNEAESDNVGLSDYSWTHPDPGFRQSLYNMPSGEEFWKRDPTFEALSYVWGSQKDPNTAAVELCSGMPLIPSRAFFIGQGLAICLRNLRYNDSARTLWIDKICINQEDKVEKGVQVGRMRHIFKMASRVVAWIGPEKDDSSVAISTLEYLGKQLELTTGGYILPSPDAERKTWYIKDVNLPYSPDIWNALEFFCQREWFKRLWVAQEIILANHLAILQCGQQNILWALFRRAMWSLYEKKNIRRPGLRGSIRSIKSMLEDNKGYGVSHIILYHQHRDCSNKHDKVYGLLGLTPPKFTAAIVPNYSGSVAETYRTAFLANLTTANRWELFGADLGHRVTSAPSWVPDFASSPSHGFHLPRQLSAGISRIHFSNTLASPTHLVVTGLKCATMSTVGQAVLISDPLDMALQSVRSWEPPNLHTGMYRTGGTLLDAYAITLLQNSLRERFSEQKDWPTLDEWKTHGTGRLWDRYLAKAPTSKERFDLNNRFDFMALTRCKGRVFMSTEEGYIGLGPLGARAGRCSYSSTCIHAIKSVSDLYEGDIISIFLGCDMPLVLRPQADGTFVLVGNAFVYGLHDAAALLGSLPTPWRVQTFHHADQTSRTVYKFFNPETGELTKEDPRLEPHALWERVQLEDFSRAFTGDDPQVCDFFRNKISGEILDSDPRLLPDALTQRGVKLETFTLV